MGRLSRKKAKKLSNHSLINKQISKKLQDAKDKRIEAEQLAANEKRLREQKEQAERDALTREFEVDYLNLQINDTNLSEDEKAAA